MAIISIKTVADEQYTCGEQLEGNVVEKIIYQQNGNLNFRDKCYMVVCSSGEKTIVPQSRVMTLKYVAVSNAVPELPEG